MPYYGISYTILKNEIDPQGLIWKKYPQFIFKLKNLFKRTYTVYFYFIVKTNIDLFKCVNI